MIRNLLLAAIAAFALSACTTTPTTSEYHPEARLYDASRPAMEDVDAALSRASENGKLVIVAMGANWCHDSRAFAGWMETPRFQQLVSDSYELVYVNIGMPQTKDGHNLDVARRFGIAEIAGTPTILILSPNGELLNADTAPNWRNTASRSEDAIYVELVSFTTQGE